MADKMGKIIIIAGPTGSGESTITRAVLKKLPRTERMITATTRPPRPHEKNGVDYYFVSPKKFKKLAAEGALLEYIKVPNRNIYYGTIKKQVGKKLAAGINLVGNLELRGVLAYRRIFPEQILSIFIKPDNIRVIKRRLIRRDPTITKNEVAKRLTNARREMKEAKYYDYIVINRDGAPMIAVAEVSKLVKKFLKSGIDKNRLLR